MAQEGDATRQLFTLSDAVGDLADASARLRLQALSRRGQSLLYDALVPQVRAPHCTHLLTRGAWRWCVTPRVPEICPTLLLCLQQKTVCAELARRQTTRAVVNPVRPLFPATPSLFGMCAHMHTAATRTHQFTRISSCLLPHPWRR